MHLEPPTAAAEHPPPSSRTRSGNRARTRSSAGVARGAVAPARRSRVGRRRAGGAATGDADHASPARPVSSTTRVRGDASVTAAATAPVDATASVGVTRSPTSAPAGEIAARSRRRRRSPRARAVGAAAGSDVVEEQEHDDTPDRVGREPARRVAVPAGARDRPRPGSGTRRAPAPTRRWLPATYRTGRRSRRDRGASAGRRSPRRMTRDSPRRGPAARRRLVVGDPPSRAPPRVVRSRDHGGRRPRRAIVDLPTPGGPLISSNTVVATARS